MTSLVFWRLAAVRPKREAFRGSRTSGRWNGPTSHPVYAADSIALAALERLVYVEPDLARGADPEQHLFRVEIPDGIRIDTLAEADLPRGWVSQRAPLDPRAPRTELQRLGDRWWSERASVALEVPSAHVPEQRNLLLNPAHPDFAALVLVHHRGFRYDPRLGHGGR